MENTLVTLFVDQLIRTPDSIAVIFEDEQLTYKQLDELSSQLANYLIKQGVKKDHLVPICVERNLQMIVGILGILKTGAAYVPIDPEYPKERIRYMLEDSGSKIVLTNSVSSNIILNSTGVTLIKIYESQGNIDLEPTTLPQVSIGTHDLSYVIYTSGSTGKPKGVMIEHYSVYEFITWCKEEFSNNDFDIVFAATSICFDLSIFEIFFSLSIGKPFRIIANGLLIKNYLHRDRSILINSVPSVIQYLIKEGTDFSNVAAINMAGEPIAPGVYENLDLDKIEVRNLYGPTEDTTYSTIYRLKTNEPVNIGHPIDGTVVYICGNNGELCAVDEVGEICISGKGLARGYWNRPELTNEKFVPEPFSNVQGSRMYLTGDLGRWLPDGNIQYCGRMDHQVKIRGYRIELGEIENVILQSGLVIQSVVLAKDDADGNKNLVGYIVPDSNKIKLKEKELYQKQVEDWKEVYESEYSENSSDLTPADEFNIVGWNDSFTGENIPVKEMQEWLSDITRVILAEKPESVVEIGCGTGLIYYKIAPHIKTYRGSDFSKNCIAQINSQINKAEKEYPETHLQVCAAHEVEIGKDDNVDTVIINSVIQYFPGEDYLFDVLGRGIKMLNGKGRLILGDVRDVRLLKLFRSRIFLSKLSDDISVREFNYIVDQEVLKEEELCVSPQFFYNLKAYYPEISHIDISWKEGAYINELSLYRYTVVIYIGIEKDIIEPNWLNWSDTDALKIDSVLTSEESIIAIENVPNPRLWKEELLQECSVSKSFKNIKQLSLYSSNMGRESAAVGELVEKALAKGYRYKYFLTEDALKINLLLEKETLNGFIKTNHSPDNVNNTGLTNVPLLPVICSSIQKDIHQLLLEQLPNYMVPASINILSNLPVTSNGKVDRQFLISRSVAYKADSKNYKAPISDTETLLIGIWEEILGVNNIGTKDDFFELGGNSIIAIKLILRLEKEFGSVLPLATLFQCSTITALAERLSIKMPLNLTKCLIPIRAEGSKPPLYIVHGGGLIVYIFNDIARKLPPDQPVYGFQAIGLDGTEKPVNRNQEIAARYVAEILEHDPHGPYTLSGYSLGGVIAFEMAMQLKSVGKEIRSLILIDTYLFDNGEKTKPLERLDFYLKTKFFNLLRYPIRTIKNKLNLVRSKTNDVYREKMKLKDENDKFYTDLNTTFQVYLEAYNNYHIEFFDGEVNLIKAKIPTFYIRDFKYLGWKKHVKNLIVHEIPGDHFAMFKQPYDDVFIDILIRCIGENN